MSADRAPRGPRLVRWTGWLLAGAVFGLVLGFVLGLAKPRVRED